ncbi:hypothetical protein [Myxococcus sp. Y35]|uniref:hypothetical protein n=1 Tax=Pseudomyxococcus flavus TaxID=3115648 RepID=UPI003CE8F3AF
MQLRKTLGAAALVTAATMASMAGCSGRDDGSDPQPDAGCVGTCTPDSGTGDAGTGDAGTGDAGTGDAGVQTVTIREARLLEDRPQIILEGVVVTTVAYVNTNPTGVSADFWVADPNNPQDGIFVQKYRTDPPNTYVPARGDVLTIQGYVQNNSRFRDREGYRKVLKNNFDFRGTGEATPMVITKTGTMTPPNDIVVSIDNGFGNSDGGSGRPSQEYLGARVHIQGPLTLTDANPMAMKRLSAIEGDDVHYGFEVSGGVLVNNNSTFGTTQDGGTPRCDYRVMVNEGGSVTFPDGIRGVWDTFTHAPCMDGGTSTFSCFNDAGVIPGANNTWTTVLYPEGCHDLPAEVIEAPPVAPGADLE